MTGQSTIEPVATEPGDSVLDPSLQAYIGQQLRSVYEEVLNEDVPDRFMELLQALERKQAEKS